MARKARPDPVAPAIPADDPAMQAAAKLYPWARGVFGPRAVQDVFVWRTRPDGRLKYAFAGDAGAMLGRFGFADGSLNNRGLWLDRSFNRSFGSDAESHEDDDMGPGSVLRGILYMLGEVLGVSDMTELELTLLPAPGYPWQGPGTVYYSVRNARWVAPEPPPWRVTVTARPDGMGAEERVDGADWCALAPRLPPALRGADGSVHGDGAPIMVTHALELHGSDEWATTAADIARCGGLLFPSLAVGPIPAANFGPCVLVADPLSVLRSLKPYRQRGARVMAPVYATDAYTPTTREFIGNLSARLWDELTGRTSEETFLFGGRPHLYALGPPTEDEDDGAVGNRVVKTTAQLLSTVKRRFKIWSGPLDQRGFDRVMARVARTDLGRAAEEFAYLEAKVHAIMPMDAFVAAWVPAFAEKAYTSFLRALGYHGVIHVLATDAADRHAFVEESGTDTASALVRYNYAWRVAAEVARLLPQGSILR